MPFIQDPAKNLRQRAFHEAGHYTIAFLLKLPHRLGYLSVELGTSPFDSQQETGGGVGINFPDGLSPEQWGLYSVAGMAAQRQEILLSDGPEILQQLDLLVAIGGGGDLKQFRKYLGNDGDSIHYRDRATDLLKKHWHLVEALALELLDRGTLYHEEGFLILSIVESGDTWSKECLEVYRGHRAEVEDAESDFAYYLRFQPTLKKYETLRSHMEREGWRYPEAPSDEDDEAGEDDPAPDPQVSMRETILDAAKSAVKTRVEKLKAKAKSWLPWS